MLAMLIGSWDLSEQFGMVIQGLGSEKQALASVGQKRCHFGLQVVASQLVIRASYNGPLIDIYSLMTPSRALNDFPVLAVGLHPTCGT